MGMTTSTDLYDLDDPEYDTDLSADGDEARYLFGEEYCDYCEVEGHAFSHCPARDDEYGDDT